DDLERTLQIRTTAVNWPLGNGPGFRGVYDRINREVNLYERVKGGAYRAPVSVHGLDDETVKESLDEETLAKVRHELELLDGAGEPFDLAAVRKGDMTPVFFGSAANNFGVQFLLDAFVASAPPPGPRMSKAGLIPPDHPSFSGFIFKIQSNMDPRHRDRIAFLRICSGKFVRDMQVVHSGSGETVRLSSSHKVLGRERESITEAFPGDVIGLVGHSRFGVGDTLSEDPAIVYPELPRFAPECFAIVHRGSTDQDKRFRKGIEDLLKEGLAQVFMLNDSQNSLPVLGAVGPLQFEVLQYRLKAEYGAASRIETKPWKVIRWISPETQADFDAASIPNGMRTARDEKGESVLLSDTEWDMKYFADRNPKVRLATTGSAIAKATEAPVRWTGAQAGKASNPLAKWNSESLG
ncbi:MAG: peptide chain release factor 3, partial [Planctomycetes bacterium]|nr:peptide chain release factor 3 [Planctomycetota bacterium]